MIILCWTSTHREELKAALEVYRHDFESKWLVEQCVGGMVTAVVAMGSDSAQELEAPAPSPPDGLDAMPMATRCFICLEGAEVGPLLDSLGCGCRGSSGAAHLCCLVSAAVHSPNPSSSDWIECPTCKQRYHGDAQLGLARAFCFLLDTCELPRSKVEGTNFEGRRLWLVHPMQSEARANLAGALSETGRTKDLTQALPLFMELLAVERQKLGIAEAGLLEPRLLLGKQWEGYDSYYYSTQDSPKPRHIILSSCKVSNSLRPTGTRGNDNVIVNILQLEDDAE